ncbi:hypothetical protein [Streptomyces wuyuanensis]|uniref:hypothetical protein n=1 Tax=Streptomyces wuyuanensis TaxID=1196353 RepID=UPI0037A5E1ED
MNPQSWLDAFVERNQVDLARMRGYWEHSLAHAAHTERKKRPRPERIEGAVLSMDVRDRALLAATNPTFGAGKLVLKPGPNRSVGLIERSSGVKLRVRKIKEPPDLHVARSRVVAMYQPRLDEGEAAGAGMEARLGGGYVPLLVWSIDSSDLLGDFLAVVLERESDLNRSPLVVCAKVEVPDLDTLHRDTVKPNVLPVQDDFENLVAPRRPRREAGGAEGAPPGA